MTEIAVASAPKFVPVTVTLPAAGGLAGARGVFGSRDGPCAYAAGRAAAWFLAIAETKTMPNIGGLRTAATNPSVVAVPVGTPRFCAIKRPIKKVNILNLIHVSAFRLGRFYLPPENARTKAKRSILLSEPPSPPSSPPPLPVPVLVPIPLTSSRGRIASSLLVSGEEMDVITLPDPSFNGWPPAWGFDTVGACTNSGNSASSCSFWFKSLT